MPLSDYHCALLQAVMNRGAVNSADARELIERLFEKPESTQSYMYDINIELDDCDMMIKQVTCEITGQKYWILITTLLDNGARFQTEFSPAQLELMRKILSAIITSDDGSVPSTLCLNLCSRLESKMSKADAEDFLESMVQKMWLARKSGQFYMGVRSIAELIPYFKATYNDQVFNMCALCRQTVFHGKRCTHCNEVLHLLCYVTCARVQSSPKCPSCSNIMTVEDMDELADFPEPDELDAPVVSSPAKAAAGGSSGPTNSDSGNNRSMRKRFS
ncbi:non-structural maintenance of chromosomes element 1 homolog [Athalia rosae]|uniref:non-structural maintenance of chromosomes element 1 homolog n=1 Tax=Athalia rosae TaxID=37344 RepID=UPI002034918F|nr:non-structural maintenance of chromosomes element 1 homolog [Athalia rosae]